MIPFWIVAACLLAGALLFVLPPLLGHGGGRQTLSRAGINLAVYRDELRQLEDDAAAGLLPPEQHEIARLEIERRVAEDVVESAGSATTRPRLAGLALALGLALPAAGVGTYLLLGSPAALDPAQRSPLAAGGEHALTPQQIAARVDMLAARLRDRPDDLDGWLMLARSLVVLRRFDEAAGAYRNATRLLPDHPDLLSDYADVMAMAQGRRLAGQPEALALRALAANPRHVKALALAGSAAFERRDYAQAIARWTPILDLVPADSQAARSIRASLAEARRLGGMEATGGTAAAPAAADTAITGRVSLAPALAARAAPDDTLYIYARAEQGPPMPLAILRRQVRDLPLEFRLDDGMAMTPDLRLSRFPRVVVSARISKSGSAMPGSGDLQSAGAPLAVGGSVRIVIDRVLP